MSDPKIISIGDDYRQYPKRFWGTRDKARAAAEARASAQLRAVQPLPGKSVPGDPSAFRLYGHGGERGRDEARARRVDRLLGELGIRPRR